METITQDMSHLGTVGANKVLGRKAILSLTTQALDLRLKNGEVQRRFKKFMDRGIPTGDGHYMKCSESDALERAINEVFLAPGSDYNPADSRPYLSFCENPAVMARFKKFASGKDDDLHVDLWMGGLGDVAGKIRAADKAELSRMLAAEMAGRNDSGEPRDTVVDAIIAKLAASEKDDRSAAEKTGLTDEERAAIINEDNVIEYDESRDDE